MGVTGGGIPLREVFLRPLPAWPPPSLHHVPSAADAHVGAPLQCVTWGGGNGVPQLIFEILSFLEGVFLYIKF